MIFRTKFLSSSCYIDVIFSLLFCLILSFINSFIVSGFVLLVTIFYVILTKSFSLNLLKRLGVANFFVLFIWITMPFSFGSNKLFSIFSFYVYKEGLIRSLVLTFKINSVFLVIACFFSKYNIYEISFVLKRLKFPNKLILLIVFTWRHIQNLLDSYYSIKRSSMLRGFKPGFSKIALSNFISVASAVLILSAIRLEKVKNAMILRCFSGYFPNSLIINDSPISFGRFIFLFSFLIIIVFFEIIVYFNPYNNF